MAGTDRNGAADASRPGAARHESPHCPPRWRRDRRHSSKETSAGLTPPPAVVPTGHSVSLQSVTSMINTCSCVDGRDQDSSRAQVADRRDGAAAVLRMLTIGAACLLTCACGGGGSGSDAPVATPPPPAKAELAWDSGNWDQQEWH